MVILRVKLIRRRNLADGQLQRSRVEISFKAGARKGQRLAFELISMKPARISRELTSAGIPFFYWPMFSLRNASFLMLLAGLTVLTGCKSTYEEKDLTTNRRRF